MSKAIKKTEPNKIQILELQTKILKTYSTYSHDILPPKTLLIA